MTTSQFDHSDRLHQIRVDAELSMMYDLLFMLRQDSPQEMSPTAPKAPMLKELHLELLRFQQQYIPDLQKIVDALALTLAHRANMGSHLDRLVVSDCLTTKVPWEECMHTHEVRGVEQKLHTVPCCCDRHYSNNECDDDYY